MGDGALSIRTLRKGEREALLALLDGWEAPSGWTGRGGDFFRRYVELDPTFAADDVWVAERAERLVGCVQIFPRRLRLRGAAVPTGGIGTVFTRPELRRSGVASALLARALEAMRARGLELSLLFAERHAFYGRLGWTVWPRERPLWLRTDATAPPARGLEPFEAARDLEGAFALHARYSGSLDGTVVRDLDFYRAQLAFAGNPREEFVVARERSGALQAYARGAVLSGFYVVTELARRPELDAAGALADLVVGLMQPREPDPLETAERPSTELRKLLVAPCLHDGALEQALELLAGESPEDYLRRALPPGRLVCWPADRF
jgi:GNAT superfamily N-acetyltransferase